MEEYTDEELFALLREAGHETSGFAGGGRAGTGATGSGLLESDSAASDSAEGGEAGTRDSGAGDDALDAASDGIRQSRFNPAAIMGEAQTQGFSIPRAAIAGFLICVLKGVMTKSLPEAVKDCALGAGAKRITTS